MVTRGCQDCGVIAVESAPIGGICAPGFEAVSDAFVTNFAERGEVGAAVCVVVRGSVVVDLWGGWAGPRGGTPWQGDTLVNVFSVGKAFAALCAARLVDQGLLDVDETVGAYWPEFAAAGKRGITVGQLLSHQAGLPAVRRRLPPGAMLNHELMCAALEEQEPWWDPGSAHGYHTNTFGYLVGELVRRIDGRSLGTVLREDIAAPLAADAYIGLPEELLDRVAEFQWLREPPPEVEPENLSESELMEHNGYFNPSGLSGAGAVNTREWRMAEIPSTNGHASARAVARIYEALAAGGEAGGVRVVDRGTLDLFTTERSAGMDLILHRPSRFGLGFQLTQPERPLGPGPRAFGHFGAGGSLGFCDPDAGVAFGYVINSMGPRWQNPLNRSLIDAVFASLG
jgi:CubicO group peptidase (beta-lactamase class C family)